MEIDWPTLRRLRTGFLAGTAGAVDYWETPADLVQYDATFAQRIGWKWDFVMNDLRRLGWQPPSGTILDWGCGSGVACRALLDNIGPAGFRQIWLTDRSPLAVQFATARAREKFPECEVEAGIPDQLDLLVVSHVLSELAAETVNELIALAKRATAFVWVEPGTFETSHALLRIREQLRIDFQMVAPCPHQGYCGVLTPGNESHWCHQFAVPPAFVFTDPFWTAFSKNLEIDLRSLPLSYLVADRRAIAPLPANAVRVLGRPVVSKPEATILGCTPSGLIEGVISKRARPGDYRQLKKGRYESLQRWTLDGRTITNRADGLGPS